MAFTSDYDSGEAQICMTLASIAYSSENDPTQIQQAIIANLKDTSFATGGDWALVWGPGLAEDDQNLVYVAQDTTQPARYAVVTRGTDWCFYVNFQEDFEVFHQSPPGFGPSDLLVSDGALEGLTDITTVTAKPVAGGNAVTFLQFLQNQYATGGFDTFDVFVTGHSLGGCLASITFPWIVTSAAGSWSSGADLLNVKAYTFAAPTAGNAAFASYVTGLSGQGPYYYWSVVNPRDLPPYAWANLEVVIPNDVVVAVRFELALELITLMSGVISKLLTSKVSYAQPTSRFVLTNTLDFSSTCGTAPVAFVKQYFCWVGGEHAGDTYLTLLGAMPTNIVNSPNCPPSVSAAPAAASDSPVVQQQIELWKEKHPK